MSFAFAANSSKWLQYSFPYSFPRWRDVGGHVSASGRVQVQYATWSSYISRLLSVVTLFISGAAEHIIIQRLTFLGQGNIF